MSVLHEYIKVSIDIEGLRDLLRLGENPNSQDDFGRTPLFCAVLKCEKNPLDTDNALLFARELINAGANVNLFDTFERIPLHIAVGCRNIKMIELLLQFKADVNKRDKHGRAPLHYATSKWGIRENVSYDSDLDVVKLLLKYNAEINLLGRDGETALISAVKSNNLQIVRELLKNNASGYLMDLFGRSAMWFALVRRELNASIVRELMKYECPFDTTYHAVYMPISVYYRKLLEGPLTKVDVMKAKYVFKLFMFGGDDIHGPPLYNLTLLYQRQNCNLSKFILKCGRELQRMPVDELGSNLTVYDIAMRGAFQSFKKRVGNIPLEVFDMVLDKLIKRQYPMYSDLIVEGICKDYMKQRFAECFNITGDNNKYFNFDVFYNISQYLSSVEMLNIMTAYTRSWRRRRYMLRFAYNSKCSVS